MTIKIAVYHYPCALSLQMDAICRATKRNIYTRWSSCNDTSII